jgi:Holliday junction resolvasome RuvABC endonuclease subunit
LVNVIRRAAGCFGTRCPIRLTHEEYNAGKATKQDVGMMVGKILHLPPQAKQLDDELDAIAIALTHSAHRKTLLWK